MNMASAEPGELDSLFHMSDTPNQRADAHLGGSPSVYTIYRKLENGDLVFVNAYSDLEEATQLVSLFNQSWPGEYFIEEGPADSKFPKSNQSDRGRDTQ